MAIEDIKLFGDMLFNGRNARNGKERTTRVVAKDCGVNHGTYCNWETGRCFPPENKLPVIAQVLRFDLTELTEALKISKKARQEEVTARKRPAKKRRVSEKEFFSGEISSYKDLMRTNSQVSHHRFGRS